MDKTTPVQIRLDDGTIARLDSLVEDVAEDPKIRAVAGRVSRSSVARLAIFRGLSALEAEYKGRSAQEPQEAGETEEPGTGELDLEESGTEEEPEHPKAPEPEEWPVTSHEIRLWFDGEDLNPHHMGKDKTNSIGRGTWRKWTLDPSHKEHCEPGEKHQAELQKLVPAKYRSR